MSIELTGPSPEELQQLLSMRGVDIDHCIAAITATAGDSGLNQVLQQLHVQLGELRSLVGRYAATDERLSSVQMQALMIAWEAVQRRMMTLLHMWL